MAEVKDHRQQVVQYVRVDKPRDMPGVAEVVLCRPQRLNTMDDAFFEAVGAAFRQLNADPEVNVVLLWAEGRLFTAGLDLKASFSNFSSTDMNKTEAASAIKKLVHRWQSHLTAISQCSKPVIAAVHNKCLGGGIDLITACDIRLCTEDATFSIAETKLAIVADLGTLQRITPIVGKGFAREMAFTAEEINATRAHNHGLVNSVYKDKDELLKKAREMAKKIASYSPLVVQGTKKVLNYSDEHSTEEGLEYVALWNTAFLQSDDLMEAMMSFMQKRSPTFKNRL